MHVSEQSNRLAARVCISTLTIHLAGFGRSIEMVDNLIEHHRKIDLVNFSRSPQ